MKDPGIIAALIAAGIATALYAEGGIYKSFAGLILLAVLITPAKGMDSILLGSLKYLEKLLTEGVNVSSEARL